MTGKPKNRAGLLRRLFAVRQSPSLPAGLRLYAVGDIHGRLDLLERLLAKIKHDAAKTDRRRCLVFLGDYVDRGADSQGVVDRLISLDWPDWKIVFLRGNHDQTMLDFLDDPAIYRAWRGFGAAETLLSYGVAPPRFDRDEAFAGAYADLAAKLPAAHRRFLENLKYLHVVGDFVFVHAGIRPGVTLDRQVPADLLWIRDEFLLSDIRHEKMVVHGHSPLPEPVRLSNRIGVDTGAYATGRLSAAVLEGEKCTFLTASEAKRAGELWQ